MAVEYTAFFLVGPTAVGKTAIAHALAMRDGCDIVSADAMSVYRGMDIGTAKPDRRQRAEVRYFGIDLADPRRAFSVSDYLAALAAQLEDASPRRPLLVVGGTGLYLKALARGLREGPPPDPERRRVWEKLARERGADGLLEELTRRAPDWAAALPDKRNPRRLIRALEWSAAGHAPAALRREDSAHAPFIGFAMPPDLLRGRIDRRIRDMLRAGLWEEASRLAAAGGPGRTALQAIGYAEAFEFLAGRLSEDDAIARIAARTRQLAKRQMTWLRHQALVDWIDLGNSPPMRDIIETVDTFRSRYEPVRLVLPETGAVINRSASPSPRKIVYEIDAPPARVRDLPANLRPREIVALQGVAHVPDDILIALLLRLGIRGLNVIDLARELLKRYGSLTALARASETELAAIRGVGPVKAQILRVAFELGRRLDREASPPGTLVRAPADVAALLGATARMLTAETFWAILLDTRNRLKSAPVEITRGILDASLVHPREVFREAIQANAAACILAHNHPSGDTRPSGEDLRITRQLVEAGRIVNIRVLDHVILGSAGAGGEAFMSLRESGMVAFEA